MKLKEKFFEILPLLILVNIFALIFYVIKPSVESLYHYIPLVMITNLLIIILCFSINIKKITKRFSSIRITTWLLVFLILIMGFLLREFAAPHTHHLYFDEDIYLNIAQNIAHTGKSILCNYGMPAKCFEGILNKQPHGLPSLISIIFFIFGTSENIAAFFMIIVSSLSIVLIFLAAYLLFRNEMVALLSAFILSLNPLSIFFAPTISAESLFVFFALTTTFSLLLFLEEKRFVNTILLASSLAFTVQVRPEAPLLVIPLLIFIIKEKINKKIIISFALFLVLISPYAFHSNYFKNESWGNPEGNKFSSKYMGNNFEVNGKFFFNNEKFPVLYTIFAFFGIGYMISKRAFLKLSFLLVWFVLFFVIYLLFYAGSFNYGIDVRFSQTLFVPVFILAGAGAYFLSENLNKIVKKINISISIVILLIILFFMPFIKFVSAVGEEAWDARTDHDFAMEAAKDLGASCTIFTHVPSMFLLNGNNALQTSYYSNSKVVNDIFINSKCVLFHEGYWCVNYKPFKDTVCKDLKEKFNLEAYRSITVKEKTYTLYKMAQK